MSQSTVSNHLHIIEEYGRQRTVYDDFSSTLAHLLDRILRDAQIKPHSVNYRCKEVESLRRKVSKEGRSYEKLSDITDIAGVRVITYFANDVDQVSKLIESEFAIDRSNSIDKRALLDPDRFGYVSLHYVLELTPSRALLAEYRRFKHLKAEIQVRSLLQHTWAEIEHDLGYKSAHAVPASIRRRFARLAGLLELADSEFLAIRTDLAIYAKNISEMIETQPEAVQLDRLSLLAFLRENEVMRRIDLEIALSAEAAIEAVSDGVLNIELELLTWLGVKNVAELEALLVENESLIWKFSKIWLASSKHPEVPEGIGLLYFSYVMMAKIHDKERIANLAQKLHFADASDLPDRIFKTATQLGM